MLGAVQERLPKISAGGKFTYWAPWDVIGMTWRIQGSVGDKWSENDASLADKWYISLYRNICEFFDKIVKLDITKKNILLTDSLNSL